MTQDSSGPTPTALAGETADPAATKPAARAARRPTAGEVRDYLISHPGFLAKHPEVLEAATLPEGPERGDGRVVDLQQVMMSRLRSDNARLKQFHTEVLGAARANLTAQGLVHEAILMLLEAGSLERLIHAITQDLAGVLGIDVVTLCVEAGDLGADRPPIANLFLLPEGTVDHLLGPGRAVHLWGNAEGPQELFGPAAGLVRSQALARIDLGEGSPPGLIALGSREATQYEANQGAELLGFLALTVERLIQLWLKHGQ